MKVPLAAGKPQYELNQSPDSGHGASLHAKSNQFINEPRCPLKGRVPFLIRKLEIS
jgi:hypothetical protein